MNRGFGRIVAVLVAVNLIASAGPAAAGAAEPASRAAVPCRGADEVPTSATLHRAAKATLCLLNEQRTRRGLPAFRADRKLEHSARRYAHSMVSRHFFSHVAPNGESMADRMHSSGYLRGGHGGFGENIAWGSGTWATPDVIVRNWMHSASHRANILSRRYRDIGVGIVPGAPTGRVPDASSYVTHFGYRSH